MTRTTIIFSALLSTAVAAAADRPAALEVPPVGVPLPIAATPGQRLLPAIPITYDVRSPKDPHTLFKPQIFGLPGTEKDCPGRYNYLYAVTLPYGVIRCAPILYQTKDDKGNPRMAIGGMTHLEESGTGGAPQYGNLRMYVLPGDGGVPDRTKAQLLVSHLGSGGAECVSVLEQPSVRWSTVAGHAGSVHRIEPLQPGRFSVVLDLGAIWGAAAGQKTTGEAQQLSGASYRWISDTEVEVTQRQMGGWGYGGPWSVHARLRFSKAPVAVAGWDADLVAKPGLRAVADTLQRESTRDGTGWTRPEPTTPAGMIATFDAAVDVSIGMAFTSPQRAGEVLERDVADGYEAVRDRANEIWRTTYSRFIIEGADAREAATFYTQWYACQLLPSDRTGDNPLWGGKAPFYDDFYTMWDTFHTLNPLLTFILPKRAGHLATGLVDMAENEGHFFDGRAGNHSGRSQAGCMGEIVAAEAALKRLPYVDPQRTLKAVVRSSTTVSPKPYAQGRFDVEGYWNKGYVHAKFCGASRTIEYARTDWTISLLARSLGDKATEIKYAKAANSWENLWNDEVTDGYFKGFVWGKDDTGAWAKIKDGKPPTIFNASDSPYNMFAENQSDTYSLNVVHDVDRLAARCGGVDMLLDRLLLINVRGAKREDYAAMLADREGTEKKTTVLNGNEPDYDLALIPHLLGRPDIGAARLRLMATHTGDDAGAGNARVLQVMLGLTPVGGLDIYLLTAPFFPRVLIQRDDGTTVEILAPGATGSKFGRKGPGAMTFIASAKLNGKVLDRAWITHEEMANGGKLEFTLSETPTPWGVGQLPPCRGRLDK